LEQKAASLMGFDPIVNGDSNVTQALADSAELALLHMITSDPNRSPNIILFGNPDYFLSASGHTAPPCTSSTATPPLDAKSCFVQSRTFAWNHGDFQNDIVQTWLGIVGPGVKNLGETGKLFTDHTDIRPTILSLTHLTDDYAHDGRVIFEIISDNALPVPLRGHTNTLTQLAEAYRKINAPTGALGIATLTGLSTQALAGDDSTYAALEAQIMNLTSRRNAIASQMIAMLENAAFNSQKIDEVAAKNLIAQAQALLNAVN
jgi:hypothetical protein